MKIMNYYYYRTVDPHSTGSKAQLKLFVFAAFKTI